jgi:hypothetical protein
MSTIGYAAEPAEVEQLARNLLGDVLDRRRDPLIRYHELTTQQALLDAVVSWIKRERGVALAELRDQGGLTYSQVAQAAGLGTQQRAQQLIAAAQR